MFAAAAPENMPAPSQPLASPALVALSVPLHPIPRPRGMGGLQPAGIGQGAPPLDATFDGGEWVASSQPPRSWLANGVRCRVPGREEEGSGGDDQKVEADVEAGRRIYLCLKEKGVGNP